MFGRLLFSRAKRKFVTEGWNFRTRNSVPAFQYSRATTDDYSRAAISVAALEVFFNKRIVAAWHWGTPSNSLRSALAHTQFLDSFQPIQATTFLLLIAFVPSFVL